MTPLSHMELRQIVGQLLILGFRGSTLSYGSRIIEDLTAGNLGGVILFDRFLSGSAADSNIVSMEQVARLCEELQTLAQTKLLISVDQEGGMVRRLKEKHGFPALPSAAELGSQESPQRSAEYAETTGRLLAQAGINCNFAPVADLNVQLQNPVIGMLGRSFSADPARVTAHCQAWLDGLNKSGVLGCLKHFPGHGSSMTDSHKGFVDISGSWSEEELLPYRELIGKNKVKAVMMGHLFHSGLDADHPASLSAPVIGGILRGEMGYEGLVITDDMQMRGITERYGIDEAIVLALKAGVDMIIVGNNLEYDENILEEIVPAVARAVDSGTLSLDMLKNATRRVQRIKGHLP